ncbi:MAG: hypothetical protein JHC30_06135 [Caldisericum sp.]|nr:hypothetical protein [Caldisericum sp.]
MRIDYEIYDGYFYFVCESENYELLEQLFDEGFKVPEFYHLLNGSCRIAVRLPFFNRQQTIRELIEIAQEASNE